MTTFTLTDVLKNKLVSLKNNNQLDKNKIIKLTTLYMFLLFIALQAISMLTSVLLNLYWVVMPYAIFSYLWLGIRHGSDLIITASIFSIVFIGLLGIALSIYSRSGILHKIAIYILLSLGLLGLGLWLTDSLFVWWEGLIRSASPFQVLIDYFLTAGMTHQHLLISLLAIPLVFAIPTIPLLNKLGDESSNLYGNAHWANYFEAKQANLFVKEGIMLGKKWGRYLISGGYEHIIIFSPSGAGKTRSIMLPTLLTSNSSIVVNDPKLELFRITSKFRQAHGQKCFLWSPASKEYITHRYNPFTFVPTHKIDRIKYLQKIAHILIPDSTDPTHRFFAASSRTLLISIALYLMDTPGLPLTFGEILRTVQRVDFFKWLEETIEKRDDLDSVFYRNMAELVGLNHETRSNILKSFTSYLELWDDPVIDAATSASDFDIRNLRRERTTIYIGFTPDDVNRLSPLLTIFWQQVLDFMTAKEPEVDETVDLILMMEEFATLRRMESLKETIGLLRSYRVRVAIVIQQISQILSRYGEHDAKVFTDARIKVAFTQGSLEDAKFVSEFLGNKTIHARSTSKNSSHNDHSSSSTETWNYQKRPLMLPEELTTMNEKKVIIMSKGCAPIYANQSIWSNNRDLRKRPMGQIDVPKQTPTVVPFIKLKQLELSEEEKKVEQENKIQRQKEELQLELEKERLKAAAFVDVIKEVLDLKKPDNTLKAKDIEIED